MTTNESERDRLCRLYIERDKEFEAAKTKRSIFTILGYAVAFFLIFWAVCKPQGLDILGFVIAAIVISGIFFLVNATVFGYLSMKGREEAEILDSIRNRIKEIDRRDGVDRRSIYDRFKEGM